MKIEKYKIIKNTVWFGFLPRVTTILNLISIPIITPFLDEEDYGSWGLIGSYVSIFTMISTLGLHGILTNAYFDYGPEKFRLIWNRLFFLMLLGGGFSAIISAVFIYFGLPETTIYNRFFITSVSIIPILIYPVQVIAEHYFTIIEQPQHLVLRNMMASLTNILIGLICIKYFGLGFVGWVIGSGAASTILLLSYVNPIFSKLQVFPKFEKSARRLRTYLLLGLPVIPHSMGHALLSSSDRVILELLNISLTDIGIYTNGYQMGSIMAPIVGGLLAAISSTLQRSYRSHDYPTMVRLFHFCNISVQAAAFLLAMWMREVYHLLIRNDQLHVSMPTAIVATYTISTATTYMFLSTIAFINRRTVQLLWLVFVPALINILMNFVMIPVWGYKSAAISTVISQFSICILPIFHPYYRSEVRKWIGRDIIWISSLPAISLISLSLNYYILCDASIVTKLILTTVVATVTLVIAIRTFARLS